jgi:hypothetical protein
MFARGGFFFGEMGLESVVEVASSGEKKKTAATKMRRKNKSQNTRNQQ